MRNILTYDGQSFINFRDFEFGDEGSHCYQWIDLKKFLLSSDQPEDSAVLASLISQVEFRDDYVGGGVDPAGTRHGPYWLNRITAEAYQPASKSEITSIFDEWTARCGKLPQSLKEAIQREVLERVGSATSRFTLKTLADTAVNDYGRIHSQFHEIVLIDRTARSVQLIVAADD